jgi:hypothetical protein
VNPFDLIRDRVRREKSDSATAYCDTLLNTSEFLIRHLVAVLTAMLPPNEDSDVVRYRAEFELLRSNGIGDWSRQAQQYLAGPNFGTLSHELRGTEFEGSLELFTRILKGVEDEWAINAIAEFREALNYLGEKPNESKNLKLIEFVNEFPRLRNKMDAHGAPTSNDKAKIAGLLEGVVLGLLEHAKILNLPIVRIDFPKGIGSGEPRVLEVVGSTNPDRFSVAQNGIALGSEEDGLYVETISGYRKLNLVISDEEVQNFFYASGDFREKNDTAEFLNYVSAKRQRVPCEKWTIAPKILPESLTAGEDNLRVEFNTFTNYPLIDISNYVPRLRLENELTEELTTEFRRVITLKGIGGVGKTSLALRAAKRACEQGQFDVVIWVSARDLDLLENTSRQVRPNVQSSQELAAMNWKLFSQLENIEGEYSIAWLTEVLRTEKNGKILWILDNFETLQDPSEVYTLIDRSLGPSNRVLITTRHRDFYGDYQIEVRGLEKAEFAQLVSEYSKKLGINITEAKANQMYIDTDGHPYIARMLISEMRNNPLTSSRAIVDREELQNNLLERTFSRLTENASILFLLISNFKSSILGTAIKLAVFVDQNIGNDVDSLVEELLTNSLIEVSVVGNDFLVQVPNVAQAFGKRKLATHEQRTTINAMKEVLILFGPIDQMKSLEMRQDSNKTEEVLTVFWRAVKRKLADNPNDGRYIEFAREVGRNYPSILRDLAVYFDENNSRLESINAWKMYIEAGYSSEYPWHEIAKQYEALDMKAEALQAWVSRALSIDATIKDISHAANKVNGWNRRGVVRYNSSEKRVLVDPLIIAMEKRIEECDADDLSRLAHLHKNLENWSRARAVATLGLEKDPENQHCLRLLDLN